MPGFNRKSEFGVEKRARVEKRQELIKWGSEKKDWPNKEVKHWEPFVLCAFSVWCVEIESL